jgi:hypothetical protein
MLSMIGTFFLKCVSIIAPFMLYFTRKKLIIIFIIKMHISVPMSICNSSPSSQSKDDASYPQEKEITINLK